MLSEKKMILGVNQIDFWGMHLENGSYHPQPHNATKIQNFLGTNLSPKQVQQFLGFLTTLEISA